MTPFSQREAVKNAQRGESYAKHGFTPYLGEFLELDLTATWYCPQCADEDNPLVLSTDGLGLFCTQHYHVCEYCYHNQVGRDRDNVFLSAGYSNPLTLMAVKTIQLQRRHQRVVGLKASIKADRLRIKALLAEIALLEQQLNN